MPCRGRTVRAQCSAPLTLAFSLTSQGRARSQKSGNFACGRGHSGVGMFNADTTKRLETAPPAMRPERERRAGRRRCSLGHFAEGDRNPPNNYFRFFGLLRTRMLHLTHSVISVVRRVVRACGGGPARAGDGMLEHGLSILPRQPRTPRLVAAAQILGAVITDRSPERWLPPLNVNAPPASSRDLCSLG